MSALSSFNGMWRAFREIDVGSMREDAQITPRLAVIGPRERTSLLEATLQQGPRTTNQLVTAVRAYRMPLSAADLHALASYDLRIALLENPAQVTDDDVQALIPLTLPHRCIVRPESALRGRTAEVIVADILANTPLGLGEIEQ